MFLKFIWNEKGKKQPVKKQTSLVDPQNYYH